MPDLGHTIDLLAAEARARSLAANTVRARLRLPPRLPMSEWAARHRYLSPESSASPGLWRNEVVPYGCEPMDTISGSDYNDVTIVAPSQSAKTEIGINNPVAYYIDQEPSPILVIQPNVKPMAEAWSKERLAPMLRDCPRLRGKVKDARSRNSGNTILQKTFAGGILAIMGANSPAGLASRPIRILLCDELDRWERSAGTEGDPLALGEARTKTFRHRRKVVKVSSPGNEGQSRIEKEFAASDQRHYYVPCPHCAGEWDGSGPVPEGWQVLEWRDTAGKPDIRPGKGPFRLVWEKEVAPDRSRVHRPETAAYACRWCGCLIQETCKPAMVAAGRWVKHNPTSERAGFAISGLLLPWVRWSYLASKWLMVKDDPEQRRVFYNTELGLLYVVDAEVVDADRLASDARREAYGAEVPQPVRFLTMSIDVQGDRLEYAVWGWGLGEEVWILEAGRAEGSPEFDAVWEAVEAVRVRPWKHQSGAVVRIGQTVVDSQFMTDRVYRWVKPREGVGGAFAVRGDDGIKEPINRGTRNNREKVKVFSFNPTQMKDILFARLKRASAGPGYIHIGPESTGVDREFLQQFAAEKRVVDWKDHSPVVTYKKVRPRNESIDLYNMGLVGLRLLPRGLVDGLPEIQGRETAAPAADSSSPPPVRDRFAKFRRGGR